MAEQALVRGDADLGALDLTAYRLAAQLPVQLADLRDGLRGDRLAEARQPTGRVHRHTAANRRCPASQQRLRLALSAQPQVLVPVEFERSGEVLHLRKTDVLRPDSGFGIRSVDDLVLEHPLRSLDDRGGIGCNIRQFR